ncbi:MAG: T9SS type A sorting domain-containing protein, partial [Bacteroidia bacterium]|nr:T9SS type A sorting domain-containing protein [Bacteroidia bacterium]
DIRPDADLALFPNPTTGVFSLTARLPQGNTELEIYDTVGRVVYTAAQPNWDGSRWEIDLSGRMPGIYLVRVGSDVLEKPVIFKAQLQAE